MKIWINILAVIVFIAAISLGKVYWNNKVSEQSVSRPTKVEASSDASNAETTWKEHAQNLPKSIKTKIQKAEQTKKPLKLVIVGSAQQEEVNATWSQLLKKEIEDTYGSSLIHVDVREYKNMTTLQFIKSDAYKEVAKANPDVLLFEPFLLNDNGVVGIENTLDNVNIILTYLERQNEQLITILQPAAPVYKANNYPFDAKALEEFAKENGYEYINHWKAWPDYQSEKISAYLTQAPGQPNDKGEQLWAQYLEHYFTNSTSNQ
ncbi:SGNH/GDSL hydrolase family protein [Priestia megaterium]|uniref:SGNH/GDSL hydrolase family protein n=1 Tax=Priestia megaterium TaxID=1404 RepID=UPI00272FED38|nr:SGNH/GDSL hydrolase family protein [Priestia megaterium]MDP1382018.1 SGNH/GDSL hydrolase family protein [Priestia megaterium]MDP1422744.1 SGNH/GDSL hydrolase family protein [Priestia megaterium]